MKKLRFAVHLYAWPPEILADRRRVMEIVSEAGYDGVEGFSAATPEELVEVAALAAEYGLHLVNLGAPEAETKAKFNATLGNCAAEISGANKPEGREFTDEELDAVAASLQPSLDTFNKYHVKPFHHIHVGTILETPADCARLLERLPDLWLLFDTGHLLATGSDPLEVLRRWPDRIAHVHLKNFCAENPAKRWNRQSGWDFFETARFCDLAEGNVGFDVKAALDGLVAAGYTGWVSVEEDHPRRDIIAVVRDNREFLRGLGY
jgi:inosose dehydratase